MSDIIAAVGGPKIVNINGTDRTFKELSLYDKAALLKRVKAAQKDAVLADLTEAGVTDAETRYGTINDITNKKFGESDWIDLANDREGGQIMILEASLSKTYPGEAAAVLGELVVGNYIELVAYVAGLTLRTADPADDAVDEEGNPLPPGDSYANPTA